MKPGRPTVTHGLTAVTYLIQTGSGSKEKSNYVIKVFILVLQMEQKKSKDGAEREQRQGAVLKSEQITTGSYVLK